METITVNHIGLLNFNEAQARKFYSEVMGLEEQYGFELNEKETEKIFGFRQNFKILVFGQDRVKLEVFIPNQKINFEPVVNHICIELQNRSAFLDRCRLANIKIVEIPKPDKITVFVKDYAGNIFEVKEILND